MTEDSDILNEISNLQDDMAELREELRPIMSRIRDKSDRVQLLKKRYWANNKDDLHILLKEPEAWSEMQDLIRRRFGMTSKSRVPVETAGYSSETNEQAFRISLGEDTEIEPVAEFLREVIHLAAPTTREIWDQKPRWVFAVDLPNIDCDTLFLATEDRENFYLIHRRGSLHENLFEPSSLEQSLELITTKLASADFDEFEPMSFGS